MSLSYLSLSYCNNIFIVSLFHLTLPGSCFCGKHLFTSASLSSFSNHSSFTKHFTVMEVKRLNSEDYCSKTDPSLLCECTFLLCLKPQTNKIAFKQLFLKDVSVGLFNFVVHSSLGQRLHTARISLFF